MGDFGVNGRDRVRSRSGQAWQAGECLLIVFGRSDGCRRVGAGKVKQEQEACRRWLATCDFLSLRSWWRLLLIDERLSVSAKVTERAVIRCGLWIERWPKSSQVCDLGTVLDRI